MLPDVESMARARHVLREFGDAAFGIVKGEDEIAGRGLAHGRGVEAFCGVVVLQHVQVAGFEANVQPAEGLRGIGSGIQLDELAIVDLDEGLGGFAGVGHGEGLLKAELAEEGDFAIEVADTEGDVRDASNAGSRRWRLSDQSCRASTGDRE